MIIKKNNQFAVECQTKEASDCPQQGEFCDSEDEARDWVEYECWLYSGEGWICIQCNEYFMANIKSIRKSKGS
ncbi:MAG: hypothetical protein COV66_15040 [Nitrospinae bacterium CG11_big_fil_rev_8_21_14_0_20_45_15]|nr:MAG: hypothetical protein COV66_15040 [Nitrospinae bacterium CG11_big_fil_rev_8_21_14_0_20_45_15]